MFENKKVQIKIVKWKIIELKKGSTCVFLFLWILKQHLNEENSHLGVVFIWKVGIIEYRIEGEVDTMLIQFNFKNYKSFRDEATLDPSLPKMTDFSDRVFCLCS